VSTSELLGAEVATAELDRVGDSACDEAVVKTDDGRLEALGVTVNSLVAVTVGVTVIVIIVSELLGAEVAMTELDVTIKGS
jgi:hypothetical protein